MIKTEIFYKIMRPFVLGKFKKKYHPIVYGAENIPKKGAIVFCGNHRHVDDQYNVMLATDRVIYYMAKDEYFKGNKAWFYRAACCIPVDRSIHDETAKNEARKILNRGGALGIFPEGTRNKTFGTKNEVELLPFKYGAVSLAKKCNALIIPFGTRGEYNGEKGQLITHIGEPIDVSEMDYDSANKVLKEKIIKLMKMEDK